MRKIAAEADENHPKSKPAIVENEEVLSVDPIWEGSVENQLACVEKGEIKPVEEREDSSAGIHEGKRSLQQI